MPKLVIAVGIAASCEVLRLHGRATSEQLEYMLTSVNSQLIEAQRSPHRLTHSLELFLRNSKIRKVLPLAFVIASGSEQI